VKKSFDNQEVLHCKSKHGTKSTHPSSSRAFQRHQEHDLKHPGYMDLITTKQNKTKQNKTNHFPSLIDGDLSNCISVLENFPGALWLGFPLKGP
jgi:hypothetical protein